MPRIRSIKPEFFRHRKLYLAEQEAGLPLRVAFAGLWCCADREGRFKWEADTLKLDCLPWDPVDFGSVLSELAARQFIIPYQSGGKLYGYIPGFLDHQRIPKDEAKSTIPDPPIPTDSPPIHSEPIVIPHGSIVIPHEPPENIAVEGKGRERKGKERKGMEVITASPPLFPLEDPPDTPAPVQEVWDHYRTVWGSQRKTPGDKNRGTINARLEHFTVDQLKLALDTSKLDDWHEREKYSKLENLIGSDDKVDSWLRIAKRNGTQSAPAARPAIDPDDLGEKIRKGKEEDEARWAIRAAAVERGEPDPGP